MGNLYAITCFSCMFVCWVGPIVTIRAGLVTLIGCGPLIDRSVYRAGPESRGTLFVFVMYGMGYLGELTKLCLRVCMLVLIPITPLVLYLSRGPFSHRSSTLRIPVGTTGVRPVQL